MTADLVHLGVDFRDIVTQATLADAMAYAFRQLGRTVSVQALRN